MHTGGIGHYGSLSDMEPLGRQMLFLACRNLRTRDGVAVEVVVDVSGVARIGSLDVAGNLHSRRQAGGTAASDLELSTADIKLWGAFDGQSLAESELGPAE
jgi:hypothetical protein